MRIAFPLVTSLFFPERKETEDKRGVEEIFEEWQESLNLGAWHK